MSDWTDHCEEVLGRELIDVEPAEPPARCDTCGGSMWLVDSDDNGLCDECWARAEKIGFEEQQRLLRESIDRERRRMDELTKQGVPFS